MRTFIAIDVPKEIQDHLSSLQAKMRDFDPSARLTFPKEFHITLKFLGDVDEKRLSQVIGLLEKVPFTPFSIHLGEPGHFDDKFLKVAWVGIDDLHENVIDLQKAIDKQLLYLFQKETKFHPHITLARIKSAPDPEMFREKIKTLLPDRREFRISSFKLIKSTLEKEGPVYEVLKEYR